MAYDEGWVEIYMGAIEPFQNFGNGGRIYDGFFGPPLEVIAVILIVIMHVTLS